MTRGFQPLRDLPAILWLSALVIAIATEPWLNTPRWLMIHLLLLGALSHSIFVWSRYFADALLKPPSNPIDSRNQSIRLILLNAGVIGVVVGVLTDLWPLTVAGAAAVSVAALWQGASFARLIRRALPDRFAATVRYYIAAAALLPIGAGFGAALAYGLGDPLHDQFLLAHTSINLLGWMGLTIIGTQVTFWPTMLRTKIVANAELATRRALPVFLVSIAVITGGALVGSRPIAVVGIVGYLAGLTLVARPFVSTARNKAPESYSTWSVMAGLMWFFGCLMAIGVAFATAPTWLVAGQRLSWFTPLIAVGVGAQVLLGAMTYLIPMALGGGPSAVRAASKELERAAAFRVTAVNAGLLVCAFPAPNAVRVLAGSVVAATLAAYLPLMARALVASHRARIASQKMISSGVRQPRIAPAVPPKGQRAGMIATGLAVVLVAVSAGIAIGPSAAPSLHAANATSAGVTPTGKVTRVAVTAKDMRFHPAKVSVPAGNRLVIALKNTDTKSVHDLVLATGAQSGRLSPGQSTTVSVGVVGRSIDGWCSVVGHRQMGMVFKIVVTGAGASTGSRDMSTMPGTKPPATSVDSAAADLDFMAKPSKSFTAHNPVLPPITAARTHRHTFRVSEVKRAIAPGVTQRLWMFGGSAPGPTLHGRIGDVFEITLINDGTIGHSIDFHAGSLAPDKPMRTIAPGKSLVYRFTATKAGIWMYHCASMPMSAHIANGMFGAVIIDPPNLPKVDHSYVLIQSEFYLGAEGNTVDVDKIKAEKPDAVVFNGYVNQYNFRPLTAKVGERVRVWVLDAGPNRSTSFHVIGSQFDTVYAEGRYLLKPGSGASQALALAPAQGGFVEMTFPQKGNYPFVSHVMVDAERGAHGIFSIN